MSDNKYFRGTGGNQFYPAPLSEEEFLNAVSAGLQELRSWAHPDRVLDLAHLTITTIPVGDRISVSVTADLQPVVKV